MTKTTRKSRRQSHNEKRARRFESAGINAVTAAAITKAEATCEGYSEASCTLCDHAIKWLFRLTLTLGSEQARRVTLEPVGSKCITDWAEALPLDVQATVMKAVRGAEKTQRRMQAEMRKAKREAKNKAVIVAKLRGAGDEDGAKLMETFLALPEDKVDPRGPMGDIGSKVIRYGSFASDRQRSFFAGLVKTAAHGESTPQAAQEPAQATNGTLWGEALDLLANGAEKAMAAHRARTMRDIASKGQRWGLSSGQERFLADLVAEARAALGAPVEAETAQASTDKRAFDPSDSYEVPF